MEKINLPRALAAAGIYALALGAASLEASEVALDGKNVFVVQKCATCHGVSGAGLAATVKIESMKGPDLSGYLAKDPAATTAFLRLQGEIAGKKHKLAFKGSDAELSAVLAWLKEQKPAPAKP